jgi:hypothetical protein
LQYVDHPVSRLLKSVDISLYPFPISYLLVLSSFDIPDRSYGIIHDQGTIAMEWRVEEEGRKEGDFDLRQMVDSSYYVVSHLQPFRILSISLQSIISNIPHAAHKHADPEVQPTGD